MTEDVFKECLPSLTQFVSVSTLLPYLLKYRLVHMADIDSVQSPYLDNVTKITNLFNLTKRNGGENGFDLLYDCLFNTSEEHRGHDEIIQELNRCEDVTKSKQYSMYLMQKIPFWNFHIFCTYFTLRNVENWVWLRLVIYFTSKLIYIGIA